MLCAALSNATELKWLQKKHCNKSFLSDKSNGVCIALQRGPKGLTHDTEGIVTVGSKAPGNKLVWKKQHSTQTWWMDVKCWCHINDIASEKVCPYLTNKIWDIWFVQKLSDNCRTWLKQSWPNFNLGEQCTL